MNSDKLEKTGLVKDGEISSVGLPLVSVIIPAYNHEKYIAKALESVLEQNYEPIEVIVIDDGSKDDTRSVLRGLLKSYDFIFIENEKNLGLTKSLNIALGHTHGKYIAILAGDDYWIPEKTGVQVDFMETNLEVAACSGQVNTIDSEGEIRKELLISNEDKVEYRKFEDCIVLNARFPAIVVLLRKDILMQAGGYDESFIMEDLPLWLKLTSQGWKLAVLPQLLGYYRIHDANMHKRRSSMLENQLKLLEKYKNCYLYNQAVRAAYSRQIRLGPTQGWVNLILWLVRGFALNRVFLKDLMMCVRSCFRSLWVSRPYDY
jgi:alpha-1,3-rhamnosyltransferase